MLLQIRQVNLWPRVANVTPRVVNFEAGVVNVITGASKTGKSAIIPIIDYCLGSDKCTIPVGTIRNACSWFGILIDTPFGQRLLARREPGEQKATGDMFVLPGPDITVPSVITGPNTNVDKVKADLNEIAGLTQLDFDIEGVETGFLSRPSFRDVIAFCFQPQNIVANPDVLLYKADTNEHRQKLRTIFPYVLGAVTPETLAMQHEVARLRTDLKRKERELEAIRTVSQRWIAEIQTQLVGASVGEMVGALRQVVAAPLEDVVVASMGINDASNELIVLEREEGRLSNQLSHLKRRLTDMKQLQTTSSDYRESLEIRRDRLGISEWIQDRYDNGHACPLCGSEDDEHQAEIDKLVVALKRIEDQAGNFQKMPAAFDREYLRIQAEIDRFAEELNAVRARRKALENWSRAADQQRYASTAAARFVGGLEEAIGRYEHLQGDSDLLAEVQELRARINDLDDQIRQRRVRASLDEALRRVTEFAGRVLPLLDVENPELPISLSTDDLTVKVTGQNRVDYLWEIGSGANWLGYHIAVILALHNLFLDLKHSAVPSFAVFDQPSQVYFPKRLAGVVKEEEKEQTYRDEDVDAVRKIFDALAFAVRTFQGRWQAIVLDHAPKELWEDINGAHLVEEWRNGNKLVPETWIEVDA
jgi:tetratricopeptide (TPR) repeat protein